MCIGCVIVLHKCNRYLMLINHPTDGATHVFGVVQLIARWRYVSMHCLSSNGGHMYFHRTVRDRTALTTEPLRNLTCIIHNIVALTID